MSGRYVDGIADIITDQLDIVELVSSYVQLKKSGRNYKGLCPFHSEKTPSFMVSEDRQLYHCFGCGASGNAIGFVMNKENLDFLDAIETLADRYHIDLTPYEVKKEKVTREIPNDLYYKMNRNAAIIYYKNLQEHESAKTYLENRGLTSETIKTFGLGVALDEWDAVYKLFAPNYQAKALAECGLFIPREKSGGFYDRFRDRIMFPIFDVRKRIIGFGGRIMGDGQPKYLNSPDSQVFNKSYQLYGLNFAKDHLDEQKQVLLVEGYMDVIGLYNKGIKTAVASLGTSLTEGHGKLLSRYAQEVVIIYDGDEAGQKATLRALEVLRKTKLKVKVVTMPEKMDPDEYVSNHGKEGFLRKLEEGAIDGIEYILNHHKKGLNLRVKSDILEYVSRIKPIFSGFTGPVAYELYLSYVSNLVGMDKEVLSKELKKSPAKEEVTPSAPRQPKAPKYELLRTRLVAIAVNEPKYIGYIANSSFMKELKDPSLQEMISFIATVKEDNQIEAAMDHLGYEEIMTLQRIRQGNYLPAKSDRDVDKVIVEMLMLQLQEEHHELQREKTEAMSQAITDQAMTNINKTFGHMIGENLKRQAELRKIFTK